MSSAAAVFRDFRVVQVVVGKKRTAGTVASGVINLSNPRGERTFLLVKKSQGSGGGAIKPFFYKHATVSATASGMTLFASGTNFTGSIVTTNAYVYEFDNRNLPQFLGVKLSTGTASAIGEVLALVGDLKISPPSAADDGVVAWTKVA